MEGPMRIVAWLPLVLSLALWAHFLYVVRKATRPMWSGAYIPLRAQITEKKGRTGRFRYIYEGEEKNDIYVPSAQYDGTAVGSTCYVYYNPKSGRAIFGLNRELKTSYVVIMALRNCLPLLIYVFYWMVVSDSFPPEGPWQVVPLVVIGVLALLFAGYHFPRWRRYKRFAKSALSMVADTLVVERRAVSARRDCLFYRSLDEDNPFTGEVRLARHPMRYDAGDTMPAYYDSRTGESLPQFAADKMRFAGWGVGMGLFIAIMMGVYIFGLC